MNPQRQRPGALFFAALLCLGFSGPLLAQTAPAPDGEVAEVTESSTIMNQPMDGSSAEALSAYVEKVREEATEEEFVRLRNALGKMRIYDLSINHDAAKLAAAVDGKTPEEVIEASAALWR
jgi:hypothetical protein